MVLEFTDDSHLQGNKYFKVVHGKTDKSKSVGLHKHDFVEVLWIREGSGVLIHGGKTRVFSKNFLYISRPNEVHALEPARNTVMEFSYVAIAKKVFERFKESILIEEDAVHKEKMDGWSIKLSPFEVSYLDRSAAELMWQNDSLMAIFRFLLNLYWQVKNVFVSALPSDMPDWLSDACQRIRNPENLALGLPKFRQICGKDMSYINRAMRRYMNCTPTEFINSARLHYAKWLLETSAYSTGEISEICGFSDLPYFCRKFRDKYECTPTQFRRKAHSEDLLPDIDPDYKFKNSRMLPV